MSTATVPPKDGPAQPVPSSPFLVAQPGRAPTATAAPAAAAPPAAKCPRCLRAVSAEMGECPDCRTLLRLDTPSAADRLARIRGYSLGQLLFREREWLFEAIHREEGLKQKLEYYACYAFIFAAIYGAFLGSYSGWLNMASACNKIPVLFFGTLLICAPSLFTFNVLLGSKLTLRQTLTILVVATYLTSAVLVSLSPIVFFFIVSGSGYNFVVLLNVIACAIAGGFGVHLVWGGMRYLTVRSGQEPNLGILKVWMLIYMFVGTQLAWTLRPFVGVSKSFALFRHLEGDFYSAMLAVLQRLLGT